jgi:hypothetical protein
MGLRAFFRYRANWDFVAHVAQLAEHVLGKDEVIGSIPIMGSRQFGTVKEKQNSSRR